MNTHKKQGSPCDHTCMAPRAGLTHARAREGWTRKQRTRAEAILAELVRDFTDHELGEVLGLAGRIEQRRLDAANAEKGAA